MGLDVSYDAFSGAYSAFDRFREAVCKATGGNWGRERWEFGEGYRRQTHPGLYEFFCHSDCDGEISPDSARKCADEMEALLPELDKMGSGGGHLKRDGGIGVVARKWIASCRDAAAAGESLKFS